MWGGSSCSCFGRNGGFVQWVIGGCGCVCRKVSAEGMFVSYRSAAGQDQASSRGWGGGHCLVGQQQLCYRKSPGRVEVFVARQAFCQVYCTQGFCLASVGAECIEWLVCWVGACSNVSGDRKCQAPVKAYACSMSALRLDCGVWCEVLCRPGALM